MVYTRLMYYLQMSNVVAVVSSYCKVWFSEVAFFPHVCFLCLFFR